MIGEHRVVSYTAFRRMAERAGVSADDARLSRMYRAVPPASSERVYVTALTTTFRAGS